MACIIGNQGPIHEWSAIRHVSLLLDVEILDADGAAQWVVFDAFKPDDQSVDRDLWQLAKGLDQLYFKKSRYCEPSSELLGAALGRPRKKRTRSAGLGSERCK